MLDLDDDDEGNNCGKQLAKTEAQRSLGWKEQPRKHRIKWVLCVQVAGERPRGNKEVGIYEVSMKEVGDL